MKGSHSACQLIHSAPFDQDEKDTFRFRQKGKNGMNLTLSWNGLTYVVDCSALWYSRGRCFVEPPGPSSPPASSQHILITLTFLSFHCICCGLWRDGIPRENRWSFLLIAHKLSFVFTNLLFVHISPYRLRRVQSNLLWVDFQRKTYTSVLLYKKHKQSTY